MLGPSAPGPARAQVFGARAGEGPGLRRLGQQGPRTSAPGPTRARVFGAWASEGPGLRRPGRRGPRTSAPRVRRADGVALGPASSTIGAGQQMSSGRRLRFSRSRSAPSREAAPSGPATVAVDTRRLSGASPAAAAGRSGQGTTRPSHRQRQGGDGTRCMMMQQGITLENLVHRKDGMTKGAQLETRALLGIPGNFQDAQPPPNHCRRH